MIAAGAVEQYWFEMNLRDTAPSTGVGQFEISVVDQFEISGNIHR
jgi:hypothetical protein